MSSLAFKVRRLIDCSTIRRAENPIDWMLGLIVISTVLFCVCYPLSQSRYPAMIDLGAHVSTASIVSHFSDPKFHFREQFEFVNPVGTPYHLFFLILAILLRILPIDLAVRVGVGVALLMVPIGFGVILTGLRKSLLLVVLSLPLLWGTVTHWGFMGYMMAQGFTLASIGLAILLVSNPSRGRQVVFTISLLLVFFTHVYKLPSAILGSVAVVALFYKSSKSFQQIIVPISAGVLLGILWLIFRPGNLNAPVTFFFEPGRFSNLYNVLWGSFRDRSELLSISFWTFSVASLWIATLIANTFSSLSWCQDPHFRLAAWILPLGLSLFSIFLFLILPDAIGVWWYVYQREAPSALLYLLLLFPALPQWLPLRAATVLLLCISAVWVSVVIGKNHAVFGADMEEFQLVADHLPMGPKLFYKIDDQSGTTSTIPIPFANVPFYAQAKYGGWINFHFAVWKAAPIQFREDQDAVISPRYFDIVRALDEGFYEWFLFRAHSDPSVAWSVQTRLELVANSGYWWLYRKAK